MNDRSSDLFERFLRAAHRRWVAWRALERTGLSILAGCAVALPMIAILWMRGEPALPTVLFVLGLAGFTGLIWGITRRPTLLETAMQVDRQFELHDLLGTTLMLPRCADLDDASRATIAAMAEARCRELSASRLILRRLGGRAWGGIGLATALVITLSLMTTSPTRSIARTGAAGTRESRFEGRTLDGRLNASDERRAEADLSSTRESNGRNGALDTNPTEAEERANVRSADGAPANGEATGAGGTGEAQTNDAQRSNAPIARDVARTTAKGDTVAGGTGRAFDPSSPADDAFVGGTSGASPARAIPPWRASTWSDDRARALRSVERGAIPDAYRDLVCDYFDRDAE